MEHAGSKLVIKKTHQRIHTYTHTYTHIHIHTHIHNTHTYICKYIHTHLHTHIHTHIHTYTHTHTYIYIYIYIYISPTLQMFRCRIALDEEELTFNYFVSIVKYKLPYGSILGAKNNTQSFVSVKSMCRYISFT